MSYYFSKTLQTDFDSAIKTATESLSEYGFGIISEIDLSEKFKAKLDVDFRKYKILGACNPAAAHKALSHEDKIGTMLPCNVIVQELDEGKVEVAAIDPVSSMIAVENKNLAEIATDIRSKLKSAIENL